MREKSKISKKKIVFIIAICICTAAILVCAGAVLIATLSAGAHDDEIAAFVDGEPITALELKRRMDYEFRAATIDYFCKEYGAEISDSFWDTKYDGSTVTPLEYAKDKALQSCVLIKLQQMEMRSRGIINDISYASFLQGWNDENERRAKTVADGGVIYGPQKYSENEYFEYLLGNQREKLKEIMAKDILYVSEDEAAAYYQNKKDELYKLSDTIAIKSISLPYKGDERGEIEKILEQIRANVASGQDFASAASENGEVHEQIFSEETARNDSRYNEAVKLASMQLSPGELSGVIDDGAELSLAYCVSKEAAGYSPYDDLKDNVMKKCVDEKYDKWLASRRDSAVIETKYDVYNAIS